MTTTILTMTYPSDGLFTASYDLMNAAMRIKRLGTSPDRANHFQACLDEVVRSFGELLVTEQNRTLTLADPREHAMHGGPVDLPDGPKLRVVE